MFVFASSTDANPNALIASSADATDASKSAFASSYCSCAVPVSPSS